MAVTEGRVRTVRVPLAAHALQALVLAATADSATEEAGTGVMAAMVVTHATAGVSVAAGIAGRAAIAAMAVLAVVRHAAVALARNAVLATAPKVAAVTMRALMKVARMLAAPMLGAVTLSR